MKTKHLLTLFITSALVLGCSKAKQVDESLAPGDVAKWNDPNFKVISVGSYNYTDYDIYSVYLLPLDKNDIRFAAHGTGHRAIRRDEDRWSSSGSGADLAWDFRWGTPKKIKVWWFRVVDMAVYSKPRTRYDQYTMKETEPGGAWCEDVIEVLHPPLRDKAGDLMLHFFPDGHVEGDIDFSTEDGSRVNIKKRDALPVLKDRACLKEVPNPHYGQKKPTPMY